MEIIKRTSILVKTRRRYVVENVQTDKSISCERCAGQMIPAQTAAIIFNVSSRVIYRFIEQENIHFAETNEIYVCPVSVETALKTIK